MVYLVNTSKAEELDNKILQLQHLSGCHLKVTSGYRSPRKNKRVGGAQQSYHLLNRARDLVMVGRCPHSYRTLATLATTLFEGVISYPTHLHVDDREIRFHKHFDGKKYSDIN